MDAVQGVRCCGVGVLGAKGTPGLALIGCAVQMVREVQRRVENYGAGGAGSGDCARGRKAFGKGVAMLVAGARW